MNRVTTMTCRRIVLCLAVSLAMADSIWVPWTTLGNPCVAEDAALTFQKQSTYILPVPGKPAAFIFMGDRWRPKKAIDGWHLWLPIQFNDGRSLIEWKDEWDLSFDRPPGER
jgi:hypothetical protein